jgi:cell division control protein 7
MATAIRRQRAESFRIHEDVPSTEDTDMNEDNVHDEDDDEVRQGEDVEDQESIFSESSDDEAVDVNVQQDMDKLQNSFPGFPQKYRLIKKIGEGENQSCIPGASLHG